MEGRALLHELADCARALGLEVRIEPFSRPGSSAGGLCLLRGRRVVLIDATTSVVEQTSALAEALAEAFGASATLGLVSASVQDAIEIAEARLLWRSAAHPQPARQASPLERRVSVLRRPKPGLRSARPRR